MYIIGGTFDRNGGKPSYMVNEIYKAIRNEGPIVHCENGGTIKDLERCLLNTSGYDIVLWMPNVLEDVPKMRNVKEQNPRCILIGTKRNNGEYLFGEVVTRALEQKLNLCIEFTKVEGKSGRKMTLLDPLGNPFYEGFNIEEMVKALLKRIFFLKQMHRMGNTKFGNIDMPELGSPFLECVNM